MLSTIDFALGLIARGLAVFPCGDNKAPFIRGGFRAASTDLDRVMAMFTRPGATLIGVPTGATNGFAVLDIDKKSGGLLWYEANKHRLPVTFTYQTRSGGLHLWFRHKPGLRCSAGLIAPGVDVRADGGYAIWWPANGFPVLSDAPMTDWPDWLVPAPSYQPQAPLYSS